VSTPSGEHFIGASVRRLQDDAGVDQTLQNLLRALTLNLELRSRYRVFEFEASQDGESATAHLFKRLRGTESEQIGELLAALRAYLMEPDPSASSEAV
jgi:hypothetical protein